MNNEKVQKAIARLKAFEPADEPYYLCYSGGKDSDCIRILADLAGVKHDIVHNLTTVDAPETVRYIKSIPNVQIEMPKYSMWQLIEKKKMPPTRLMRYCCDELKEKGGKGRIKVTGVRWAESSNRNNNQSLVTIVGKPKATIALAEELQAEYERTPKGGLILNTDNDENRRMVEQCYRTTSTLVNPIIDWTDFERLARQMTQISFDSLKPKYKITKPITDIWQVDIGHIEEIMDRERLKAIIREKCKNLYSVAEERKYYDE